MAEFMRATADAMTYRSDLELERDRADQLTAEIMNTIADTMDARARLEGEPSEALHSKPGWHRLFESMPRLESAVAYLHSQFWCRWSPRLEGAVAYLRAVLAALARGCESAAGGRACSQASTPDL